MQTPNFDALTDHVGHDIRIDRYEEEGVTYVDISCDTCWEPILSVRNDTDKIWVLTE